VEITTLPCKKIVEKPPRNSAGFCRGGEGLNWAVEPRKEERINEPLPQELCLPRKYVRLHPQLKCLFSAVEKRVLVVG
jgi:hypothetical protein